MLRKMAFPLHMISLQLDVSAFIPFTPVFSFLSRSPNPSFPSILFPPSILSPHQLPFFHLLPDHSSCASHQSKTNAIRLAFPNTPSSIPDNPLLKPSFPEFRR